MIPSIKHNQPFPRDDDRDYNDEIDRLMEDERERFPKETDIRDSYDDEDADDLKDVL